MLFAAVHESACGPKRTRRPSAFVSAFGGEADITRALILLPIMPVIGTNFVDLAGAKKRSKYAAITGSLPIGPGPWSAGTKIPLLSCKRTAPKYRSRTG